MWANMVFVENILIFCYDFLNNALFRQSRETLLFFIPEVHDERTDEEHGK